VIRPARWLPLSLALHTAAFGGGVWAARELGERALFVDLTLTAPDERMGPRHADGLARPAAPAKRGAPARPAPAASPAPPAPRAAPSPPTPGPAPVIAAAPPAPAAAPSPVAGPAPVVESAPPLESSAPDEASPTVETSPTVRHTEGAGAAASGSRPSGGSAAPGGGGGDTAVGLSAAAAAGASGARGAGDGALALAVPGGGGAEMYGPYLAALRRRLQEALEYPAAARRRGLSGTVDLEIALEPTGRVSEVLLVRSSSHAMLDEAALAAARALARVPFPPDVRPRALRVRLPVVFELR
jgi:periplasmic protein TonB